MRTSAAGIALICAFESCRLEAYADDSPRRIPTVGYGHTGAGVMLGQRITQERAEELLQADLVATEAAVSGAIRVPLTQSQFDACCSLAFNIGTANFKWSTLAHLLNAGQTTLAGLEFHRWNHAGAKELNGLTKRRAAELALFTENARMNRSHNFLAAYRETGSITRAAAAAGVNRSLHYDRLKVDPTYKLAFEASKECAIASLEDEAIRRAREGVEEPVVWQGQISYNPKLNAAGGMVLDEEGRPMRGDPITIRKYSDSLLQFLLRGAKPATYRERHQITGSVDLNVTKFKGSLEDLLATYRALTSEDDQSEA